jgi:hypothetical protein
MPACLSGNRRRGVYLSDRFRKWPVEASQMAVRRQSDDGHNKGELRISVMQLRAGQIPTPDKFFRLAA